MAVLKCRCRVLLAVLILVKYSQRQEAIELVARAIRSGIFNDLGSGSNVDVCVILKDKTEMLRNYEMPVSDVHLVVLDAQKGQSAYVPPHFPCDRMSAVKRHDNTSLGGARQRGPRRRFDIWWWKKR